MDIRCPMCSAQVPFPDKPTRIFLGQTQTSCVTDAPCAKCPAILTFDEKTGFVRSVRSSRSTLTRRSTRGI